MPTITKAAAPAQNSAPTEPTVERLTYTAREACAALGVSSTSLWRLAARGLLTPIPGMRHRLYSKAAVQRFVEGGAH